jgi:hypothetical protein
VILHPEEIGTAENEPEELEWLDGAVKGLVERDFCCISQRGRGVYKCSFSPNVLPDVDGRELVDNHVTFRNSCRQREDSFCRSREVAYNVQIIQK